MTFVVDRLSFLMLRCRKVTCNFHPCKEIVPTTDYSGVSMLSLLGYS